MKKFLCIATLLIVSAVCLQQWLARTEADVLQEILQAKAYYERMAVEYPNEANSKGVK